MEFAPIYRENHNFQICERRNYIMPWPIVMILLCVDRGSPNLYNHDKQHNFVGVDVRVDVKITVAPHFSISVNRYQ